mmetsp:Transcript_89637/g.217476  ORF Transcript_89637/g.217476 Transcript_89637/m.217476 type:complete len:80 (-) Transcript_89637:1301-1540(-)
MAWPRSQPTRSRQVAERPSMTHQESQLVQPTLLNLQHQAFLSRDQLLVRSETPAAQSYGSGVVVIVVVVVVVGGQPTSK